MGRIRIDLKDFYYYNRYVCKPVTKTINIHDNRVLENDPSICQK